MFYEGRRVLVLFIVYFLVFGKYVLVRGRCFIVFVGRMNKFGVKFIFEL